MTLPAAVAKSVFNRQRLLLVILIIVIALLTSTVLWASRNHLLSAAPRPAQQFTELYFTKPKLLPKQVTAGQPQTVSFTVANRTSKLATYSYRVIIGQTQVKQAAVQLLPDARQAITVSYSVPRSAKPVPVAIVLDGTQQMIQIWVRGL